MFSPLPRGSQPTMPGFAGTGDPDPALQMQAKRGARRRERRGAHASRSTDGGADSSRSALAARHIRERRDSFVLQFSKIAASGGIAFPVVKRIGYFVPHWGARLDSSPGNFVFIAFVTINAGGEEFCYFANP